MNDQRPDQVDDLEGRLAAGLRGLARRATPPKGGTSEVLARVRIRRRRRQRRQAVGASVAIVVVAVGVAAVVARVSRQPGPGALGSASTRSTAGREPARSSAPSVTSSGPSRSTTSTTLAPTTVGWDHLVGVIDPAWSLTSAIAWSGLRSTGWPTPYQRTSTWGTGAAGTKGSYVVVQSEIAPSSVPLDGTQETLPTAGGRTLTVTTVNGVVTVLWTEQVADRGVWTMVARGWNVEASVLEAAVATATWDDVAERWALTDLPAPWTLLRWPNTGDPREVVLSYARGSVGAVLRIALAETPGRFGADLVSLLTLPGAEGTAIDVRGHVGYGARTGPTAGWQIAWQESDRLVARVEGPAGMELNGVLGLLDDVVPSSIAIAAGS